MVTDAKLLSFLQNQQNVCQYDAFLGMREFGAIEDIIYHLQTENASCSLADTLFIHIMSLCNIYNT